MIPSSPGTPSSASTAQTKSPPNRNSSPPAHSSDKPTPPFASTAGKTTAQCHCPRCPACPSALSAGIFSNASHSQIGPRLLSSQLLSSLFSPLSGICVLCWPVPKYNLQSKLSPGKTSKAKGFTICPTFSRESASLIRKNTPRPSMPLIPAKIYRPRWQRMISCLNISHQ